MRKRRSWHRRNSRWHWLKQLTKVDLRIKLAMLFKAHIGLPITFNLMLECSFSRQNSRFRQQSGQTTWSKPTCSSTTKRSRQRIKSRLTWWPAPASLRRASKSWPAWTSPSKTFTLTTTRMFLPTAPDTQGWDRSRWCLIRSKIGSSQVQKPSARSRAVSSHAKWVDRCSPARPQVRPAAAKICSSITRTHSSCELAGENTKIRRMAVCRARDGRRRMSL